MNELEIKLKEAVIRAGNLPIKPDELVNNKHLFYDYGFNSLKKQILILEIEKTFDIKIPAQHYTTGYFNSIMGLLMYLEGQLYN